MRRIELDGFSVAAEYALVDRSTVHFIVLAPNNILFVRLSRSSIVALDARTLVEKFARAVDIVAEVAEIFGLQVNFKRGKTELMLRLLGAGSKKLKEEMAKFYLEQFGIVVSAQTLFVLPVDELRSLFIRKANAITLDKAATRIQSVHRGKSSRRTHNKEILVEEKEKHRIMKNRQRRQNRQGCGRSQCAKLVIPGSLGGSPTTSKMARCSCIVSNAQTRTPL